MERGRYSKQYAEFLCDRFYRRYNDTCYVKIKCVVAGCGRIMSMRANTPEEEQSVLIDTFKCETCSSITRNTE